MWVQRLRSRFGEIAGTETANHSPIDSGSQINGPGEKTLWRRFGALLLIGMAVLPVVTMAPLTAETTEGNNSELSDPSRCADGCDSFGVGGGGGGGSPITPVPDPPGCGGDGGPKLTGC